MSESRILTTHVGSLVRPEPFREILRQRLSGQAQDAQYLPALEQAVHDVVRQQVQTGIDIVSDGEYGKGIGWEQYIMERVTGFGPAEPLVDASGKMAVAFRDFERFRDFYSAYWQKQQLTEAVYPCIGPIAYVGRESLNRDIGNLKAAIAKAGGGAGFLPVAAPASALAISPNRFYKTDEEFVFAGAEALREEYLAIVGAGLNLQIDDAHLPFMYDEMVPPATPAEYEKWARIRIDALNHALRGIPVEKTRYHICWGSWNGPHSSDVPLKSIVHLLLQVNVGGYSVEAANARHEHEWVVWKEVKLPPGKWLVPGVISHQTNVVEHPELVAQRIVRFAEVVGRDRIVASTDCGFAQGPFVQRVHPSIQWAKLQSLVEGARLASRQLWR